MKKLLLLLAALLLTLCLSGCGSAETEASLLVTLEAGEGFSAEVCALRVQTGEDAVFLLQPARGVTILSADYRGSYELAERDGLTELRLLDIQYPTRVRLQLAAKSGQIRYEANGGAAPDGSVSLVKSYGLTVHPRANAALGTDLFSREGHTLVCWNTRPDGSGERVGLGSRVTLNGGELVLYAQWARWSDEADFLWEETEDAVTITGYRGSDETLVIPAALGGKPLRRIAAGTFRGCAASSVILPPGLGTVEDGAFADARLTELTLFDDLAEFSDAAFSGCSALQTLHINAIEAPFGYVYRKESAYADKIDLLILAQGRKKLAFFGGCSVWYNLEGAQADRLFGSEYAIVNLGLNGTINAAAQMQILTAFLEEGDILFHTPELSSRRQLLILTDMDEEDRLLWCGLENNYDLFALVDLRTLGGVFDSFCSYLARKDTRTDYNQFYSDDYRTPYTDRYGCIPFYRSEHSEQMADTVNILPERLNEESLQTLRSYFERLTERGVRVYVSFACVNVDALPEGQAEELAACGRLFNQSVAAMGAAPVSALEDYLYHDGDFYDTNYHLLSEPAKRNTELWMRDLLAQMIRDGLWEKEAET